MACASEDYRVEVSHGNAMTPQEYGKEGSPGKREECRNFELSQH
jgi:hypothetical protein